MAFFNFSAKLLTSVLIIININCFVVTSEEVFFFNGTHSYPRNHTKREVTTVKIAEINYLKNSSTNTAVVLKEKTAKHFVTSTFSSKVVLIPPAKINAQIMKKKIVHHS